MGLTGILCFTKLPSMYTTIARGTVQSPALQHAKHVQIQYVLGMYEVCTGMYSVHISMTEYVLACTEYIHHMNASSNLGVEGMESPLWQVEGITSGKHSTPEQL